jgi:hypothetical protein
MNPQSYKLSAFLFPKPWADCQDEFGLFHMAMLKLDFQFRSPEQEQWRITLCQLPNGSDDKDTISGGLLSEFKMSVPLKNSSGSLFGNNDGGRYGTALDDMVAPKNDGTAYLVLNVTQGTTYV